MKRIVSFVLILAVLLSLAGCQSKEAAEVDKLIVAIGEVTLDSEKQISDAEAAYRKLSDEDKEHVKKHELLVQSRETYGELVHEQKVSEITAAIEAIGTVTLESEEVITQARMLYDSAITDVKMEVKNYSDLKEAESTLLELKKEYYQPVLDEAMKNIKAETDEIAGTTMYYSSVHPKYSNTRCYVLPMICTDGDVTGLYVAYNYTGKNWVFFDEVVFSIDGTNYTVSFQYEASRNIGWGCVSELCVDIADTNLEHGNGLVVSNEESIDILRKVVNSEKTTVRFQGDGHHDFTVSDEDKKAIQTMLDAYDAMLVLGAPD